MSTVVKNILLGILFLSLILGPALFRRFRSGNGRKVDKEDRKAERPVSEADEERWRELYYEGRKAQTEMLTLIGGESGMTALRNVYLREGGEALASLFAHKQDRLRILYEKYDALLREAETLPESMGAALHPLEQEELYAELLKTELKK